MPENSKNPIVEVYRGHSIRLYPRVYLRVNPTEMRRFIDAQIDQGLSAKDAIQKAGVLCKCSGATVIQKSEYAKGN